MLLVLLVRRGLHASMPSESLQTRFWMKQPDGTAAHRPTNPTASKKWEKSYQHWVRRITEEFQSDTVQPKSFVAE
jgi:hypothetical protein